jgi:hypothetical protein
MLGRLVALWVRPAIRSPIMSLLVCRLATTRNPVWRAIDGDGRLAERGEGFTRRFRGAAKCTECEAGPSKHGYG